MSTNVVFEDTIEDIMIEDDVESNTLSEGGRGGHITCKTSSCSGFSQVNDTASSLLPSKITTTPPTAGLHCLSDDQDGGTKGLVVPLGGHVADPAVHGQ